MRHDQTYVRWFSELTLSDITLVGGKNASLGELSKLEKIGINTPQGFAITAQAYWDFLLASQLTEQITLQLIRYRNKQATLDEAGSAIRALFYAAQFPDPIANAIKTNYQTLEQRLQRNDIDVAVRSSATAEDLPEASFAGQQESFLNICGAESVLDACRRCFASLFTNRAISYRELHGFDHMEVALSVGVQQMVRSDVGAAGVMFSIDTETGFPDVVLINAAWGLGEIVVQGLVEPDEYVVFKPPLNQRQYQPIVEKSRGRKLSKIVYGNDKTLPTVQIATSDTERSSNVLNDSDILQLARWAVAIEAHYGKPMDIEWAKDGNTGKIFIVQARPETVQSRQSNVIKTYRLLEPGKLLAQGVAIGEAIATGKVCKLNNASEGGCFPDGAILVTTNTDPDWLPIMRRAAAIITNQGGRTSHAAIVSRELGLPAIVGCGNATLGLSDGEEITVSCAEGDQGFIYQGQLAFEARVLASEAPQTETEVMINLANPAAAFRWWRLPCDGVGLARIEFIINDHIKIHPMALAHWKELKDGAARQQILELTAGYPEKAAYFIDKLAYGIARIAASQYPKPVIVRMSDFKTNEYAALIGGKQFEPQEENPMLGWRGASRYYHPDYCDGFVLECRAIKKIRDDMGLKNVIIMIPFCRTLKEADKVLTVLSEQGLSRSDNLQIYVMCEIPSNVILGEQFAERFDGFSIGSNDLTQLTLGVDRDSANLASLFDEENEAVQYLIKSIISSAHRKQCKVGLCGQAPSDRPQFARFLVKAGIDSISVSPDSFFAVKTQIAAAEAARNDPGNQLAT